MSKIRDFYNLEIMNSGNIQIQLQQGFNNKIFYIFKHMIVSVILEGEYLTFIMLNGESLNFLNCAHKSHDIQLHAKLYDYFNLEKGK